MAKNSKLNKLRCIIKRWNSTGRISRGSGGGGEGSGRLPEEEAWRPESFHGDDVPHGFHPVYVGKSRRRYLVSSDLLDRPLFQTLIDRSGGGGGGGHVVGCEVVLFEHLLWMLENADPKTESLDELVDFYSC
ncbi:hypothetical protein KSP40_PGU013914 [Platanthera guangdongensis]|uniref:SAUR family protein n=1 Tax=Platanthera guangdongensis TaxID=2320717 RepID=A0ABR2N5G6_9ASPA